MLIEDASSVKAVNDFARGVTNAIKIPTGVFVQSVEFSSANNVTVTGYIWQRYRTDLPEEVAINPNPPRAGFPITPGFILPEADSTSVEEVYRVVDGNEETVGWYFNAALRQEFDYAKYPFDQEEVWIRLWPQSLAQNVLLVPDLASYDVTNPASLPGVEQQDFVLEGWVMTESFFSYRENTYNTDLGIESFVGRNGFPELYFNVSLKREFINAFISNMIPIIVVALLLFAR